MENINAFLARKNIVLSARRYGIDALGAMAQGLFCSLLIGTIVKTLGEQAGIGFLVSVGGYASAMSGSAMAVAIGGQRPGQYHPHPRPGRCGRAAGRAVHCRHCRRGGQGGVQGDQG